MAAPIRVGGNSIPYASRTNSTVSISGYSIQADDIALVKVVTAAVSEAPNPTFSAGTEIGTAFDQAVSNFNLEDRLYYVRCAGGETSFTVTHTTCSSQVVVEVWRGVDWTTGPFDATQTQNSAMSSNTRLWTGLTTATADAVIIAFGSDWADTTNNLTPPSGMTERQEVNPLSYVASEVRATPGATGNRSHTANSTGANGWTARLVALRPAAGGGRTASGGGTMTPLTGTGAATITRKAAGGGTMAAFVGGGSGASVAPIEATGAATMAPLTGAGSATITRKASGGGELAAFTGGATATLTRKAAGGATLADFIGAGASNVIRVSAGGGTMAPLTGVGAATITRKAAGGATLAAFTGAGQAAIAGQASADGLMAALFGSGAATITRKATGAGVMPFFVGHGTTPGTTTGRSRFAGAFRGGFRNIVRGFRALGA